MAKSKNDGKLLESLALQFFPAIFEKMGFTILTARPQNAGTQNGFDILVKIHDGFCSRRLFIECKDYQTDVSFAHIMTKLMDLETSYQLDSSNDIAVFLSPRSNFSNSRNPEKTEHIFNDGRYSIKVRLLDRTNAIDKLFAVIPEIYEQLYGSQPTDIIEEAKELHRLRLLLWDNQEMPQLEGLIVESEKAFYLPDLVQTDHYIHRGVQLLSDPEIDDAQLFRIINREHAHKGVYYALKKLQFDEKCAGLVLLGNPGMGKSTELKELAIKSWKNRLKTGWVPFYRNVKDFLAENDLEQLLPNHWKKIPKLLIILDGLDEVDFGPTFRTRLEQFIQKYSSEQKFKMVISCRTNIFDHVIKDIARFRCYELEPIELEDARKHLKDVFHVPFNVKKYNQMSPEEREFLRNPYYLNLMGEHYVQHGAFPNNKSILMESYVRKRIADDNQRYSGRVPFDEMTIILSCQKVALAMEAMQTKKMDALKLGQLLDSKKSMFTNSCFIKKVHEEEAWEFEHRNLQEYFVARTLSKMDFRSILSFITIDGPTQKTHPSWYNSISYLINLLNTSSEIYQTLLEWLVEHDSQILMSADSDRIGSQLRNTVFQQYFTDRCKTQLLWIRLFGSDVNELAKFGDTMTNVSYLMQELQDTANHRRTRISAMDLLSKMTLMDKHKEFGTALITILSAPLEEVDIEFKNEVLFHVLNMGYHQEDGFLNRIIKSVGHIDHERIIAGIVHLITEKKSDDFIIYLKKVVPITAGKIPRKFTTKDNRITREKEVLKSALSKFENIENLLYALEMFIEYEYEFRVEKSDVVRLVEKLSNVHNKDETVYGKVLKWVISNLKNNRRFLFKFEEPLARFFKDTNTQKLAFESIFFSDIALDQCRHFLSRIFEHDTIPLLLQQFQEGKLEGKEIFYFRNVLSGADIEMSLELEAIFLERTEYDFEGKPWKENMRPKWQEYHNTKDQLSFNLLFNRKQILELTEAYYGYIGKDNLDWEDMEDYREEFYNSLELQQKFLPSFIEIINDVRRSKNEGIVREDVQKLVDNDLYVMSKIHKFIHERSRDKLKEDISVSEAQKKVIEDWCKTNLKKADFDRAYDHIVPENELRCELLWFFRKQFDLVFKKEVLLDMLKVDYYRPKGGLHGHQYIYENVPTEEVTTRIIENLENGLRTPFHIFSSHISYALDMHLEKVYGLIRTFLKNQEALNHNRLEILEKYIYRTKDIELLKEILVLKRHNERDNDISHKVIELLIELNEESYVTSKLLSFRNEEKKNENEFWVIKYLMRSGHIESLRFLIKWLNDGNSYGREHGKSLSNEDFKKLPIALAKDLTGIICISSLNQGRYDSFADPIRIVYEILKTLYPKMEGRQILKFIENLNMLSEKLKSEHPGLEVFHLNSLTNEAWDAYYKAESKPAKFPEVLNKIQTMLIEV